MILGSAPFSSAGVVLTHGLGGRSDLAVPLWLALYAGSAAVLVSFFALAFLWTTPKLRGAEAGRPLPSAMAGFADSTAVRWGLRAVGLLAFALLLATAWFGTDDPSTNPAATWFYVWFWVGMVLVSVLLGPIWRLVNPLRTLAGALRPVVPSRELPARLGYWPAMAGLFAFLWLELVYADSASPRAIAVFLTVYAVAQVVAGAIYGPRWFERGDGFEVYFGLIAALSPLGRRADGRLVLRNPLDGLRTIPSQGITPVVLLMLGSTAFDGLTRMDLWSWLESFEFPSWLLGTAGLVGAIAIISGVYAGGIWLTRPYLRKLGDGKPAEPYGAFAHALVPIMVGYTVAHYFSFAVFEGQPGLFLASDPFGLSWDLFGTAGASVDYGLVSAKAISWVQIAGIVIGHVLGVTAAHDRAIGILRRDHVKVGQYPMLAVMVAYTAAGIALVAGV